jgi:FkbM family methyltransferase
MKLKKIIKKKYKKYKKAKKQLLIGRVLAVVLKTGIAIFGKRYSARISSFLVEELAPVMTVTTKSHPINFYCSGAEPFRRADTLLTKEPDTIEWIDSFQEGGVFWDIGANVGVYSLYAALISNMKVLSFEPSAFNYHILNRNIEINSIDKKITSFCIAFNDTLLLDDLYMGSTYDGGAYSCFSEAINWHGEGFIAKFKQGMIGFSIDDFIEKFSPSFPNHIKIDVDGNEGKIINGARKTISDERLRSILVELDATREEYCRNIIELIEEGGMKLSEHKNFSKKIKNFIFFRH